MDWRPFVASGPGFINQLFLGPRVRTRDEKWRVYMVSIILMILLYVFTWHMPSRKR